VEALVHHYFLKSLLEGLGDPQFMAKAYRQQILISIEPEKIRPDQFIK